MEGFSNLIEFSIALAGFTSIVVVFVHQDEKWNPLDKFRMRNALITSLGAAFLASLPAGLAYLELPEAQVWKIECTIVAIYTLLTLLVVLIGKMKLDKEYNEQLPQKTVKLIMGCTFAVTLFIIVAILGGVEVNLKALSYFGIVQLLLLSVFAFSRLIFYRPQDREKSNR